MRQTNEESMIPSRWPMSALTALIVNQVMHDRIWLEFGVAGGATLRELAYYAPVIYGFDSWEGLPEDWLDENGNQQEPKGKFACDPPSNLPSNAYLVVGLFQDTLPYFLTKVPGPFGFVHIDCDLYSSTCFVLKHLEPWLDGTVIAFDEIRGFAAGKYHEGRAFQEFLDSGKYRAEVIGYQHTAGAVYKLFKCGT